MTQENKVSPSPESSLFSSPRRLRRTSARFTLAACMMTILLCGTAQATEGYASYYTEKSCQREGTSGVWTASGERFNEQAMTCALRRRSYGHYFVVYSLATDRSVVVRHNDYGPGKGPSRNGVIIDLSPKAFKAVCGDLSMGKCVVSVQEVMES